MDIAKNDRQPYRQAANDSALRLITAQMPGDVLDAGAKSPGAKHEQFIVESVTEKLERTLRGLSWSSPSGFAPKRIERSLRAQSDRLSSAQAKSDLFSNCTRAYDLPVRVRLRYPYHTKPNARPRARALLTARRLALRSGLRAVFQYRW